MGAVFNTFQAFDLFPSIVAFFTYAFNRQIMNLPKED
jgi:hypothetical protein